MRLRFGFGSLLAALVLPACHPDRDTPPDVLPAAPALLGVSSLSTTTAQVTWSDLSDNEAGFLIQVSPNGVSGWMTAGAASFNATSGIATGLTPGVQVFIRVASENSKGFVPSPTSLPHTPPVPAWTQIEDGPADLLWTCSAFDPVSRLMYVFGGLDGLGAVHNALRVLNVDAAAPPTTWLSLTPAGAPQARYGASLIFDPIGNRLILFGGQIDGSLVSTDELWEYRIATTTWNLLTPANPPAARQHHSAVYDAENDRMVVFGGTTADQATQYSDVAALSLPALGAVSWTTFSIAGTPPTTAPEARFNHTAVYDSTNRRMIVFAGRTATSVVQDLWTLDLTGSPSVWGTLSPSGPPSARYGQMGVWDSVNLQMVVFGGADILDMPNQEVWTLSFRGAPAWTLWGAAPPAGPRTLGTAVYDPVNPRMIVSGGVIDDSLTSTAETWSLDL